MNSHKCYLFLFKMGIYVLIVQRINFADTSHDFSMRKRRKVENNFHGNIFSEKNNMTYQHL